MPLLSPKQPTPQIAAALKLAGLGQEKSQTSQDFDELLEEKGLSAPSVLEEVGKLMVYGENENTRLAAAKLGLQLNRMLEDDDLKKVPVVNVIIQDSEYTQINPILVPR